MHQAILQQVTEAFHQAKGPARAENPKHCEECEEANKKLLDLDPRDLILADIEDPSDSWFFSFATDESIRWLVPGMVRVILE